MAVGSDKSGPGLIAETFRDRRWTRLSPSAPSGDLHAGFNAVDCLTSSSCTAVGYELIRTVGDVPLAEHWNGRSWRVEKTPRLKGPRGEVSQHDVFNSVSCPTASRCYAVGLSEMPPQRDIQQALAASWRSGGRGWIFDDERFLSQATVNHYSGVSCGAATACYGVGTADWLGAGPSQDQNLVIAYYQGDWAGGSSGADGNAGTHLHAVSCVGKDYACVAVGQLHDRLGTSAAFDLENGATYATATPAGDRVVDLEGVACRFISACVAVGTAGKSDRSSPVIEHWNGTKWSAQALSRPDRSANSQLASVSCPTRADCVAVGSRQTSTTSTPQLLVEQTG